MSVADNTGGIGYDVATALWQGKRAYQEDTLLADFHGGMDRGFAVLADGMGGHAAGDLASRLVVIDAASHLKFLMHDGASLEANLHAELTSAIETANDVLKDRAKDDARLSGMGATFLATVMFEDRLYWASVGDSPLYLWREGALRQINEDHSMAPLIDQMAKAGEISAEDAANHPDRNALTSVLMGSRIKSMDVPKVGLVLDPGDVLIQASDGLQYIDDKQISEILSGVDVETSSRKIADLLMAALHDLDDPMQDNTALLVLQIKDGAAPGGGTGTVVEADQGERAIGGAAASTLTTRTSRRATSRRWIAPAVLLGGAALAIALMVGLPDGENDPDLAASQPLATLADGAEAAADVASDAALTVVPQGSPDLAADADVGAVIAGGSGNSPAPVRLPAANQPPALGIGQASTAGLIPDPNAAALAETAAPEAAPVRTDEPVPEGRAPADPSTADATIAFQDGSGAQSEPRAADGPAVGTLFSDTGPVGEEAEVASPTPGTAALGASLVPTPAEAIDASPAGDATALDMTPLPDLQAEDTATSVAPDAVPAVPRGAVPGVGPLREGLSAPDGTAPALPQPNPRAPLILDPALQGGDALAPTGAQESQRSLVSPMAGPDASQRPRLSPRSGTGLGILRPAHNRFSFGEEAQKQ